MVKVKGENSDSEFEDEIETRGRTIPTLFNHGQVARSMRAEGIVDGDFVYAPNM